MEKVFSIVRQTYGQSSTDDLNDLDVNTATWGVNLCLSLSKLQFIFGKNGKSTIYRESPLEVCETIISDN